MNIKYYLSADDNEKPLENILENGGFTGIFRTIGCIGDSLSSGEFESRDEEGNAGFHDLYEYSWGQFMARDIGSTVYNFSKGGMTAHCYMNEFADENGFWDEDRLCQAYIIALGSNDMYMEKRELGTAEDINSKAGDEKSESFAYCYGSIIKKIKELRPTARIFLMSMPRHGDSGDEIRARHAQLLEDFSRIFENTYLLDFYKYAPVYDADFRRRYFLNGHMNPAGYLLTARMTESYIDYIIRHNPEDFMQIGFIGTPYYNTSEK